jgi:hypothetical protein
MVYTAYWVYNQYLYRRTGEPMVRLHKMALGKFSLARGINCCTNIYMSFALPASSYRDECVYTYTYLTACLLAYRLYMNYRCCQIILHWNICTQMGAVRSADDMYRLGAGLAVTRQIRDIGQNVWQSAFVTGSSSSTVTAIFCYLSCSSRRTLSEIWYNNYTAL